jgi:hypothetical protein
MHLEQGLTVEDFLLMPIYLFIIYKIFKKLSLKYFDNETLLKYFTIAFWIKIVFIIIYSLMANFVMGGDSITLFYTQGKHFANLISKDLSNLEIFFTQGGKYIDSLAEQDYKGYLLAESNFIAVKISALLCFVTFSKYLLINLIIGFIAFLGSWQLFMFFYAQYPKIHKELAFACMGIPMVIFWTCSIGKDAICMAAIGFFTKALYDLTTHNKNIIRNFVITIIGFLLLYYVKSFLILSYMPLLFLFIILNKINKTKNTLLRFSLRLSLPILFIWLIVYIGLNSKDLFIEYSADTILEKVTGQQNAFMAQAEEAGSNFTLGDFDGSIGGLVKMAPIAIVTTFFRPFIWETKNVVMILTSLEAMALMFFTIFLLFKPKGIYTFFKCLFTNATVLYCIGFSIIFAVFVGVSTFNFGSLARYKIPCIPFFLCGLMIIKHKIELTKV